MQTQEQETAENLLWTGLNRANLKTVALALEMGADVNQRHRQGAGAADQFEQDTPLHGAFKPSPWSTGARVKNTSKADVSEVGAIVKLLLEYGADASALDMLGNTPLMCMAHSSRLKFDASVEQLLVNKTKEANKLDVADRAMGYTALHHAALAGNSRLTLKICKAGANIDQPMTEGMTPFFAAAKGFSDTFRTGKATQIQKHSYTLDALINYKADANARDEQGDTVADKYPSVPLDVWFGLGLDPTRVHPVSGNNLMDLHLQRLSGHFFDSMSALERLIEVPDLVPCKPEEGVGHLRSILDTKACNEHHHEIVMKTLAVLEQHVLQQDTEHAPTLRATPRL